MIDGLYWAMLTAESEWEIAKLSGGSWTFAFGRDEWFDEVWAVGAPITNHEASLAIAQARFLCDRLDDFSIQHDGEETAREYYGHVAPALARLKQTLDSGGR